jgi:fibronectin type 3 domain-containing protein
MKGEKFLKSFLIGFASLFIGVSLIVSCVQTITNPNMGLPKIAIHSPLSGDSVGIGKNEISYEADPGDGSVGIDRYEIFINGKSVQIVPQEGTSFPKLYLDIDSTRLGEKISYHVSVYNKEGKGKASKEQTNITVVKYIKPPRAPENLMLQKISSSEVLLVWDDSAKTEEKYEVWRRDGGSGIYRIIRTLPKNSTNYRDVNLSQFVTYYYKVCAVNGKGRSPFSNEVNSGGAGGSPPTNLTAQALGATIVQLDWTDNSSAENGFKVQRRTLDTDPWTTIAILAPNSEEYIDQGLTQMTTYHYRVGAFTSNSEAYSSEVVVTTKSVDIPGPSNLVANFDATQNAVKVTWSDNTNLENGTIIERRTGLTGSYQQIGVTGTDATEYLDKDISQNTLYYYRARYSTTEGFFTPYSNEDSAYVPLIPLAAPSDLEIVEFVPHQIYGLFWTNNADTEDGIELWKRVEGDTYHSVYKIFPPRTHAYNDTITDPSKVYYYKVRAFLNGQYSSFSNEVNTAGGTAGIFRPTNLVATAVPNQIAVDLTWSDNSNNELGFEIERRMVGGSEFKRITIVGPNTQYYRDETEGLYRGSSYDYRIRAYNSQGFSEYSNIYTVTIPF